MGNSSTSGWRQADPRDWQGSQSNPNSMRDFVSNNKVESRAGETNQWVKVLWYKFNDLSMSP